MQESTIGTTRPFACHIFISAASEPQQDRLLPPPEATTAQLSSIPAYQIEKHEIRSPTGRAVYSISPAGSIVMLRAASVGGGNSKVAAEIAALLEREFHPEMTLDIAMQLAQRCLCLSRRRMDDRGSDVQAPGDNIDEAACDRYFLESPMDAPTTKPEPRFVEE